MLGMMPAQRPEDFADRRRDRDRDQLAALAGLPDLPGAPIDFATSCSRHSCSRSPEARGEGEERRHSRRGWPPRAARLRRRPVRAPALAAPSSLCRRHCGSRSKRTPHSLARVNSFFSCSVVSLTVKGEISATVADAMSAPPCDQLGNIVVGDVGDELVLAEELDQVAELPLCVVGAGMVLADLLPVAAGDIIEAQRCRCRRACATCAWPSRVRRALPLPLRAWSGPWSSRKSDDLGFGSRIANMASAGRCRRTCGTSFRVWLAMNSSMIGVGEHLAPTLAAVTDYNIADVASLDVTIEGLLRHVEPRCRLRQRPQHRLGLGGSGDFTRSYRRAVGDGRRACHKERDRCASGDAAAQPIKPQEPLRRWLSGQLHGAASRLSSRRALSPRH